MAKFQILVPQVFRVSQHGFANGFYGFIGELPKDDVCGDWSLESRLDSLFALLAQASALASMAGLELSKLKAEGATQLAGAVTAEEAIVPIFIHNPASGGIAAVVITLESEVAALLQGLGAAAPAAPATNTVTITANT